MLRVWFFTVGALMIVAQFGAVALASEPDGVPGEAEAVVCGPALVRLVLDDLNGAGVSEAGRCNTTSDYDNPLINMIPQCQRSQVEHNPWPATSDVDCDGRPNDREALNGCNPVLADAYPCAGSEVVCLEGSDNDRLPDCHEWIICLVENPNFAADGSCSNGDYTAPPL